jgi:hypothetical protein
LVLFDRLVVFSGLVVRLRHVARVLGHSLYLFALLGVPADLRCSAKPSHLTNPFEPSQRFL